MDDTTLNTGQVLVVFLTATCPACQELVETIRGSLAGPPMLVFVVAEEKDEEAIRVVSLLASAGAGHVAVVRYADPVLTAFGGIAAFPTVLLVEKGQIVTAGVDLNVARRPARAAPR